MNRRLAICASIVCMLVLVLGPRPTWSQSLASLHGRVTDPSGAAVPRATVRLTNSADNSERAAVTDQQGAYNFLQIAAGSYRIAIDAQGFQTFEKAGLQLLANVPSTLNVQLQIAQVQQSVTVVAQPFGQCVAPMGRVLPGIGPGLRALRRGPSDNYYVLTDPGAIVSIYSPDGKRVGQIPAQSSITSVPDSSILNGSDLQIDSAGRVYVADLAGNAVKIYSAKGALLGKIRVSAPVSVEPLPHGEIAVSSLYSDYIVDVYDQVGGDLDHSFGEITGPVEHCDPTILRCTTDDQKTADVANRPWFYGDASGNVYVSVAASAPTIRKYDQYGIRAFEFTMPPDHATSTSDNSDWSVGTGASGGSASSSSGGNSSSSEGDNTQPSAGSGGKRGRGQGQGTMRLGLQITRRVVVPDSKPIIDAIGVDPVSSDVWAVVGNDLVHLDRSGELDETYCLSTSGDSAVKFTTIVVEPSRILLGSDPFGIFAYPRPDKPTPGAPSH